MTIEPRKVYRVTDGPTYHANGVLRVEVLEPSWRLDAWICRVLDVISWSSRTCAVGAVVTVSWGNFLEDAA